MNRIFIYKRTFRPFFVRYPRRHSSSLSTIPQNKPNNKNDILTNISIAYVLGTGTSGIVFGGLGTYNAYQSSKNDKFIDTITETTIGAIGGYVVGVVIGLLSPIILPIGVSVAISRAISKTE
jgi:hypothetical protein